MPDQELTEEERKARRKAHRAKMEEEEKARQAKAQHAAEQQAHARQEVAAQQELTRKHAAQQQELFRAQQELGRQTNARGLALQAAASLHATGTAKGDVLKTAEEFASWILKTPK